jgi:hypothetical protein
MIKVDVAKITEIRTQAAKHSLQAGDCKIDDIQFTWIDQAGNEVESTIPTRYAFVFTPRISGVLQQEQVVIPTDNVIGITVSTKP